MRPRQGSDPIAYTTNMVIRGLARRIQTLNTEIKHIDQALSQLIQSTAPSLLDLHGVGTDTAASLLVAAGDNPQRLHSERSWAHLCGVTPIPASSGKVTRHRLNRGETATPTLPSTGSSSPACPATKRHVGMWNDGVPKDSTPQKSCAASNATSPGRPSNI